MALRVRKISKKSGPEFRLKLMIPALHAPGPLLLWYSTLTGAINYCVKQWKTESQPKHVFLALLISKAMPDCLSSHYFHTWRRCDYFVLEDRKDRTCQWTEAKLQVQLNSKPPYIQQKTIQHYTLFSLVRSITVGVG